MTEQPEAGDVFFDDAKLLHNRRSALNGVVALIEPIVPPRKLSSLTYAILNHAFKLELISLFVNVVIVDQNVRPSHLSMFTVQTLQGTLLTTSKQLQVILVSVVTLISMLLTCFSLSFCPSPPSNVFPSPLSRAT